MQRSCCLSKDCSDTVSKSANAYADSYDCFPMFTGITYNQSYKYTTHTLFSSSTAIARGFRKPGRSKGGREKIFGNYFLSLTLAHLFYFERFFKGSFFSLKHTDVRYQKREFSNKTSKKS